MVSEYRKQEVLLDDNLGLMCGPRTEPNVLGTVWTFVASALPKTLLNATAPTGVICASTCVAGGLPALR